MVVFSFDQSTMDQKADPENPKSWPRFILRVDRHMCNYLTSGKRTRLAVLSSSLKVWILLKVRYARQHSFLIKLANSVCAFISAMCSLFSFIYLKSEKSMYLQVARGLNRGAFELKLLTDETPDKGQHDGAAISVLRPKEVLPRSPSRRVTLFPIKNWKTGRK